MIISRVASDADPEIEAKNFSVRIVIHSCVEGENVSLLFFFASLFVCPPPPPFPPPTHPHPFHPAQFKFLAGTTCAELKRTSQSRVRWRGVVAAFCSTANQKACQVSRPELSVAGFVSYQLVFLLIFFHTQIIQFRLLCV